MLYIIFLVLAVVFLLLKTGLFGFNLNINFDLFYFDVLFLRLRARISPITIFLTIAWYTGLNKIVEQYVIIPGWAVLLIIFLGLPSIYETIFGKKENY